jgi:hypothetical protein
MKQLKIENGNVAEFFYAQLCRKKRCFMLNRVSAYFRVI